MSEIKGFYVRALALSDNDLLIINYVISKFNIGKIQLSNSIKLLPGKDKRKIKELLRAIEQYNGEFYIVPKHNSKL